jgi:ferredoxin
MEKNPILSPAYSCRGGACGTCACKVSDPSGVEHDDEDFVDPEKRKAGWALSCIAHVKKEGLVIEINKEEAYNAA